MEKTVEKEREIQKERETAVAAVKGCEKPEELGPLLWRVIELYAGEPFFTSKQLPFTYTVKGRELFCDRREKSITEATFARAYEKNSGGRGRGRSHQGAEKALHVRCALYLGNPEGNGTDLTGRSGHHRQKKLPLMSKLFSVLPYL